MNNLLNIKTPAEEQALVLKSEFGLENHGIRNLRAQYWNLPTEALYEEIVFRSEGRITYLGPIVVETGKHTARSASDKFIVNEDSSADKVWWGEYNRPFSEQKFDELYARMQAFLQGRDVFIQDCFGGADPNYRIPIRIITEFAWHSHFARNMFIRPETLEEYRWHVPEFTVICAPSFKAFPTFDGTPAQTFIILSLEKRLCIIGNTAYGGEIKKSIFTVLNYLLPLQGIMPMHCSANVGMQGDVALFYGLSGTGKTTLSADPLRKLIGDDEHGWSDEGIFNFEDGCYAKVIQLSPSAEPQIYACTQRFGTILENVV
jgi:phosphoenolpyruvate carboxykinase (ATP)